MLQLLFAHRRIMLAGFALVGVAALAAHPTWARSIGADVWNVPDLQAEIRANAQTKKQLDQQGEAILRRIEMKESIVGELIMARLTLAEATEQFTAINAARPHYTARALVNYPGYTEQEKTARCVIEYARQRVAPEMREVVMDRLEAELQQMLGQSAGE